MGITDYAQSTLGDIVFVDLPKVGSERGEGQSFGSVESVKAVSDLYSPVTGTVVEVNEELATAPEKINTDAHGAWMLKVENGRSVGSDRCSMQRTTRSSSKKRPALGSTTSKGPPE